jgi:hypothetical protein
MGAWKYPGTVLAALSVVMACAASASAAVLYDQMGGTRGFPIQSSYHAGSAMGSDSQAADDFIVPAGVTWTITSVEVDGQESSTEPATVVLYGDGPTVPGPEIFRLGGIPFPSGPTGHLQVAGAPNLTPGHYWLSVFTTWTLNAFNWRRQSPTAGSEAVWENPTGGAGGCSSFKPLTECGINDGQGTDMMFRLNGDAASVPLQQPRRKCKRHKHRRSAESAKKKRCKRRKQR